MKKINCFLLTLCLFAASSYAQTLETVNGFTAGANTENNIFVAVGQPFVQQHVQNGYEIAPGVAQAQLVKIVLDEESCFGSGYADYGFSFETSTPVGNYNDQHYDFNAQCNYDSLTVLHLAINPTYERKDTLIFYDNIIGGYSEGLNELYLQTQKGCDSTIHRFVILLPFLCGDDVYDFDGNTYSTVAIAGNCWTRENMKAEHYSDDGSAIPMALVYKADMYPNEDENLNIYGRLYSWYSAVKIPEGSSTAPLADMNGNVQGICPNGWHVPTADEMRSLQMFTSSELRTHNCWMVPGNNSSDFSLLPAGFYNAVKNRFENLRGETMLWSSTSTGDNTTSYIGYTDCFCDMFLVNMAEYINGFSARCVRN